MEKYFIIHGSYGNPYKNFIPWLKKELSKRGKTCIVPHFPSFQFQSYENWSHILSSYLDIGLIDSDTIFITHSLGSIFVIKFLLEKKIKIKKLITVAGFNQVVFSDDSTLYTSFYLDWDLLKKFPLFCDDRICFYSDNDPYISCLELRKFCESISAVDVFVPQAGHFNEKSGYLEFRDILSYIG